MKKSTDQEDKNVDLALRPATWQEYVGQDAVKKNLRILIDAAKQRKESCDHILFYGQAGLGKTTLAHLVAKEMGADIKITSGPTIEKTGDLASILSGLNRGDILFIDEAHRINRMIEEVLYPAMETRKLHIIIGKGPAARTLTLDLPPFTMVAATTRIGLLSNPLRSRFGAIFRLDYYQQKDIETILKRSGQLLGVEVGQDAIKVLARASRATPRVANRLLKRARDYAQVHSAGAVTEEVARQTLKLLDIDDVGLDMQDRRLLESIIKKYAGGPVGLRSLAASLSEEVDTIEDVYEPYLMNLGFLERTSKGRVATSLAYRHLGLKERGQLF
ncbi:MAG: Holliday junction DNA helicase RuvB [Parcubacteria group bacterium RIFCSPLOWO2_01_FULL_48_18]|nr:MAG: Holliday junction DNA helicase RuvB [Parcubacteria group bacterium RIFCSPLOWO2_01_FULL_48_18]